MKTLEFGKYRARVHGIFLLVRIIKNYEISRRLLHSGEYCDMISSRNPDGKIGEK